HTCGMSKRDPNSDIPGFEGEYYGTVGHEKKHHPTHFTMPEMPWRHKKIWLDGFLACDICGWKGTIPVGVEDIPEEAHTEYEEHIERKPTGARYARR
ncbi:MAG: hypothetical protein KKD77_24645, partial [Gammaproteobacteria bacterium]|nr:hypothetical protein [Gammaproteobacteria bacterium]